MRLNQILTLSVAFLFFTPSLFALEKQTRRNPLCGVEKHVTLSGDSRCPVDKYFDKVSPACKPIYKLKKELAHCGVDKDHFTTYCVSGSSRVIKDPDFGCRPPGHGQSVREEISYEVATCRNEAFGIETYESCRDPSHGIESYQSCTRDDFPVESYKECAFYKTPEELNAYIDATADSLETYREILPSRQGELFARLKSENGLGCTIQKYSDDDLFSDVVKDLRDQFLIVFGYSVEDAALDCSPETIKSTKVRVVLADIDCDALPKDFTSSVAKPSSATDAQFARFKQNCSLKKSYDVLVDWFATKSDETAQLIDDLAAKADPAAEQRLIDLHSQLAK